MPIGPTPLKSNDHPRCHSIVAIQLGRSIEAVHHHVQISVAIQIGQGHPVRHLSCGESPGLAGGLKPSGPEVSKRRVRGPPLRIELSVAAHLLGGPLAPVKGLGSVLVEHILVESIGDEQVFVPIQVHVDEGRTPRPIGGRDSGH